MKWTGRTRHRVEHKWFSQDLLVLQYELEDRIYDNAGMFGSDVTYWVDAKPEWEMGGGI